jgi:hypothetical protein
MSPHWRPYSARGACGGVMMSAREVDTEIENLLEEHGTTSGEYFAHECAPQISQLRLPPGTMDAPDFLAAAKRMEDQLAHSRQTASARVQQISKGDTPELRRQLTLEHDAIVALYVDMFRLAHQTRIIDAMAFRSRLAELLDIKMYTALAAQKARALRICDGRP